MLRCVLQCELRPLTSLESHKSQGSMSRQYDNRAGGYSGAQGVEGDFDGPDYGADYGGQGGGYASNYYNQQPNGIYSHRRTLYMYTYIYMCDCVCLHSLCTFDGFDLHCACLVGGLCAVLCHVSLCHVSLYSPESDPPHKRFVCWAMSCLSFL